MIWGSVLKERLLEALDHQAPWFGVCIGMALLGDAQGALSMFFCFIGVFIMDLVRH